VRTSVIFLLPKELGATYIGLYQGPCLRVLHSLLDEIRVALSNNTWSGIQLSSGYAGYNYSTYDYLSLGLFKLHASTSPRYIQWLFGMISVMSPIAANLNVCCLVVPDSLYRTRMKYTSTSTVPRLINLVLNCSLIKLCPPLLNHCRFVVIFVFVVGWLSLSILWPLALCYVKNSLCGDPSYMEMILNLSWK
jgi:hypothetical protein